VGIKPDSLTDFKKYGFSNTSTSAGISANFLYSDIKNIINPDGGSTYADIIFRQNFTFLGSDKNWNSLLIDARKYFSVGHKGNVLAFWTYDWLTLSGNPPYLDLPSNGWDTYSNTERGYVQSRFAGKKMIYLESEYRFGITKNGLLGGVVFANAASFTEFNNTFQVIQPGAGAGIRLNFNKFSRTNIAIDYGIGKNGSHGVFINLGEVF
jgi:outer membrane protein assembly factor BamA